MAITLPSLHDHQSITIIWSLQALNMNSSVQPRHLLTAHNPGRPSNRGRSHRGRMSSSRLGTLLVVPVSLRVISRL